MPRKIPANTIARAKRLHQNWVESNPNLVTDDLTPNTYAAQIAAVETHDDEILAAEAHLKALRETRRECRGLVYDNTKRVMNLAKARFGDDSAAYKLLGGIPLSERARPKRRPFSMVSP